MSPLGMLCRLALVIIDVSEERIASIIRVARICELGTCVFLLNVLLLLVIAIIVLS
jgi:hypothetical protein